MKAYKLTDRELQTYNGFQWEIGKKMTIMPNGTPKLCTNTVFHAYISPEMAVFFYPIHVSIIDPLLWEADCDIAVNDGTKIGSTWMTLIRRIDLPIITDEQRIEIAIQCAIKVYKEKLFINWAENWINGSDRSKNAARAAAAYATAHAAEADAYYAAYAAAAVDAVDAVDAAANAAAAAAAAYAKLDIHKIIISVLERGTK